MLAGRATLVGQLFGRVDDLERKVPLSADGLYPDWKAKTYRVADCTLYLTLQSACHVLTPG